MSTPRSRPVAWLAGLAGFAAWLARSEQVPETALEDTPGEGTRESAATDDGTARWLLSRERLPEATASAPASGRGAAGWLFAFERLPTQPEATGDRPPSLLRWLLSREALPAPRPRPQTSDIRSAPSTS